MCCSPVFPSVLFLGSTDSAPDRPGLFASFIATIKRSDCSCSFVIGFDSSPSRCGPLRYNLSGQAGDLPVLVQRAYQHARVLDHAGSKALALSRLSVLPSATI